MLARHAAPDVARLEAMRAALLHRGPEDSGIAIVGNVGLVHTRLSILDHSQAAHQPVRDRSGRLWLAYNGEIFNHLELRDQLSDVPFTSHGDTQTLLEALARWGPEAALELLNGQFAFAALDVGRGQVVLARDRFGIKPLYVASAPDGVWFASEPQALIAAGLPVTVGENAWRSLIEGSCFGGVKTLLSPVERVMPGTFVTIALDNPVPLSRRWALIESCVDPGRQRTLSSQPRRTLARELEEVLRSAVHDALMGDVQVGTLCSGGVDSSVITALATEQCPNLVAFGAHYRGDPSLDEGPAAQRCAKALGIELDLLEVTAEHWRSGFAAATVRFGAPLANASAVTVAHLAANARRRNIKVLLTGEGADELFAGYYELHHESIDRFVSARHRFARRLEPLMFGTLPHQLRRRDVRMPRSPVWSTLTAPEDSRWITDVRAAYADHSPHRRHLEQQLLRDLDYTLAHLLNRMDKNAMQMSVETRVPFLDPRVVALALNLPLEARTGPWTKGLLRDVARRLLPMRVAQRPKIYGLSLDAGGWIDAAAKPSFMSNGMLAETLGLSRAELEHTLSISERSLKVRIWSAEVWCRSMLGRQSLASIEQDLWRNGP